MTAPYALLLRVKKRDESFVIGDAHSKPFAYGYYEHGRAGAR
jgi:hypothetical protein